MNTLHADLNNLSFETETITLEDAEALMREMVRVPAGLIFAGMINNAKVPRDDFIRRRVFHSKFVDTTCESAVLAMMSGNNTSFDVYEAIRCPVLGAKNSFQILRETDIKRVIDKYFTVKNPTPVQVLSADLQIEKQLVNFYQQLHPYLRILTGKHFINPRFPFVSCAPDALAFTQWSAVSHALEIKTFGCDNITQLGLSNSSFKISNGHLTLKRFGRIYHQIQISMAILNVSYYVLMIYLRRNQQVILMNVAYDFEFIKRVLQKLKHKYENFVLPQLAVILENKGLL